MDTLASEIVLYWRPGCPYCKRLRRDLDKVGVPIVEKNIWDDKSAADVVRSIANGNETVPTVQLGPKSLVNPSIAEILKVLGEVAPEYKLKHPEAAAKLMNGKPSKIRLVQYVLLTLTIVASFVMEWSGFAGISWALDGVAFSIWGVFHLIEMKR